MLDTAAFKSSCELMVVTRRVPQTGAQSGGKVANPYGVTSLNKVKLRAPARSRAEAQLTAGIHLNTAT